MTFDYIIGNPPYQNSSSKGANKKLWKDITGKMLGLYQVNLSFVTPEAQIQYLKKHHQKNKHFTRFLNFQARDYFEVNTKIVSWCIGRDKKAQIEIVNYNGSREFLSIASTWREKTERRAYCSFENLKKTPPKNRMFTRGTCGKGPDWCIKNRNTGEKCPCAETPGNKVVLSTSQSLTEKNMIISRESFGSLYVYYKIENESDISRLKNFLFNPVFLDYCDLFKKTYGTGFNNVLIYLPEFDLENWKEELKNYEIFRI